MKWNYLLDVPDTLLLSCGHKFLSVPFLKLGKCLTIHKNKSVTTHPPQCTHQKASTTKNILPCFFHPSPQLYLILLECFGANPNQQRPNTCSKFPTYLLKCLFGGNSLVAQSLGLHAFTTEDPGSRKIKSHQLCGVAKIKVFFPVWISTPKSSFYLVVLSQFSFNLYLLTLYWIFLHATRLAEQIRLTAYRICHFLDLSDCDCSLMVLYNLFHHTPHFL